MTGSFRRLNPAASRPDGLESPEVVAGGHLGAPSCSFVEFQALGTSKTATVESQSKVAHFSVCFLWFVDKMAGILVNWIREVIRTGGLTALVCWGSHGRISALDSGLQSPALLDLDGSGMRRGKSGEAAEGERGVASRRSREGLRLRRWSCGSSSRNHPHHYSSKPSLSYKFHHHPWRR